jgi:tRNA G37 N-methylase Trm5
MERSKIIIGILFAFICSTRAVLAQEPIKTDVPFVPTDQQVVDAMLNLAQVSKNDVLYDLGCGDGRIVVTAAKNYGATSVGVDIDPQRIEEAKKNAKKAKVKDKVTFIQEDLFKADFSKATVVTLYLLPSVNLKLKPKLLNLKPGTRIVSHSFDMGDWKPDKRMSVGSSTIYLWTVPSKQ